MRQVSATRLCLPNNFTPNPMFCSGRKDDADEIYATFQRFAAGKRFKLD